MSILFILKDKLITLHAESGRFVKEVIFNKEYQESLRFDVVIDCGANIGAFSLFIYDMANKIYAIEPNNINYANLVKTVKENELEKIETYNLAISDTNAEGIISSSTESGDYGGWKVNGGDSSFTQKVNLSTLARFIKDRNIEYVDLLKIDVEGHEEKIFQSKDFAEVNKKIGVIIGEYHLGVDIKRILDERGFRTTLLSNYHFRAVKI